MVANCANEGRASVRAGRSYCIVRGNEVPFDDSKFKTGDEAAACFINPLSGDRADIKVANSWRVAAAITPVKNLAACRRRA